MTLLSVDEVKTLIEQPQGRCVSIYMPTYHAGAEIQQNPIRFKNLMRAAEAQLSEQGVDKREIRELLEPIETELDREVFWQNQDNLLAIFSTSGFLRYYRLPLQFDELVVVGDSFHLKPLLPLLTGDGLFYVLALSQDTVRLIECTRFSAQEVEVPNLPKNLEEALNYDETAKEGQYRLSTSKGGTSNPFTHAGSFHGQGSPDQDKYQEDILQYFHLVDKAISEYLIGKRAPLVLAGVEYLFPLYREANNYQYLAEEGLTGSPKVLKPETLQAEALPIVEPMFLQALEDAIARYRDLIGTQKISTDLNEAVPAAYFGRVDQLFVAVGVQKWGTFNPDTSTVQVHPDAEVGDQDLLNAAALQTLLNGGTVYAVSPEKIPDEAPLAAIFRY